MMVVNMDIRREIPGIRLSSEHLQTICCRYYTAAQFVQGKQVLEVGCGAGFGLGYLSKRAKRVIGGDMSEYALRLAQKHYNGRVELLSFDAQSLPFKNDSFDVVVVMEVLYYLSQPDKFLDECHRVLVDEGIIVLSMDNKDYPVPFAPHDKFSAQELYALLSPHFKAKVFGAFPGTGNPSWIKLQSAIFTMAGKALGLIPKEKEVKDYLNNLIFRRDLVLGRELEDKDMMVENFQLTPIPDDSPDFRHRYLYAIAYARKIKQFAK